MSDTIHDAHEMNAQGAKYYAQRDYPAALTAFTEAIALSPHPEWGFYFNRGRTRDDSEDLPGAIADYTESLQLNPEHTWSYRRRALARLVQGDLDGAEDDLSGDLRLQPNAYSLTERGHIRLRKGDYAEARADFDEAIQLDPDNREGYTAKAYFGRGLVHRHLQDDERAIADLSHALQLTPNYTQAYSQRSQLYRKRHDHSRAIADLNEVIRLQPTLAGAYADRGVVRRQQGDLAQALLDFDEAIGLEPHNAFFYESRGVTYGMQNDLPQAARDFRMVLQLDPDYRNATALHAWLARYTSRYQV